MKEEIKFLFSVIKPYRLIIALLILGSLLGSAFDGISIGMLIPLLSNLQGVEGDAQVPKALQWMVNLLKSYPLEKQFFFSLTLVILAVLLKNLFFGITVKLGYWLSGKIVADLRLRAMKLLMNVGIAFHRKSKIGEIIEKAINNTAYVENLIRYSVRFMPNFFMFLILFSLLIFLSWQLTLATVILGIVFALLMFVYTKNLSKLGETLALRSREMLSTIHESLTGIQLVKSFGKEEQQRSLSSDKIERYRKVEYPRNFRVYLIHLITEGLGIITIGLLFTISMLLHNMNTKLILTQLLPFIYILTRIVPILRFLNNDRAEIISYWPYLRLVQDLLRTDDKPFIADGYKSFPGLKDEIRFYKVTFSYNEDDRFALTDVDFSIPAGKTTAIVGQSGAGKSTIVNLLLRFYDPQEGKILVDGEPLENFTLKSSRRKIGVVSQDTFIFNDTVRYNIAFSAETEPPDEQIIRAARRAGAHEFIMDLPNGYETLLGDRGVILSGGQRQRISIARAILRDPEILILDEATSSLDTQTEKQIHQSISELSQNRTVIVIAHRLSTIKGADKIIVLKKGRIVEIGEEIQLLSNKGEYYRLAGVHQ